jgi:asparagine synthetase B (glutamine-hydrolysing)
MCGICGIYGSQIQDRSAIAVAMNVALRHRGPDDSGQYDGGVCSQAMRQYCGGRCRGY